MNKSVKISLVVLGLAMSISTLTFIQQRYYWKEMAEAGDVLQAALDEMNQRVTDLVFAGIIQRNEDDEGETDSNSQE